MRQAPDHFSTSLAVYSGLVILNVSSVIMVCVGLQQSELQTARALLRLKNRIAELSEQRPPVRERCTEAAKFESE